MNQITRNFVRYAIQNLMVVCLVACVLMVAIIEAGKPSVERPGLSKHDQKVMCANSAGISPDCH